MKYIQVFAFLTFFLTFIINPVRVLAVNIPSFTACVSPEGTITSNYPSGSFGIVGKTGSLAGSDTVYKLSDIALTQCFCPLDGNGIQTNWWKASNLTAEEINEQVSQGWILVPDGSVWGLDPAPYLALNINYSCSGGGSTQGSSTTSSNGGVGGQTLGSSTGQILGLATTGNMQLVTLLAVFGVLLTASGVLIKRT